MSIQKTQVRRTREHVENEYGRCKWPEVEALIEAERRAEPERPNLTRVLSRAARWEYPEPLREVECVVDGKVVLAPDSLVHGGMLNFIVDSVVDACTPETELVVELGAGWGRNLAWTWLSGGPRNARYVAAELTDAGRRAADALGALEPDLRLESLPFDYNEPDLSSLGRVREAVVFTVHSIEQIPHVKPALFEAIRGVADRVRCLHFEPVGFQIERNGRVGSSREYAETHDYNVNLVEALQADAEAGRVVIESLAAEVVGTNPTNSTSTIAWRPA